MNYGELNLRQNVLKGEDYQEIANRTLTDISNTLANTLGYYGSTSIFARNTELDKSNVSKDGYTVLKQLRFENEVSTTILDMIREISSSLVTSVGDGSTSSVIASAALYSSLLDESLKTLPAKEVSDELANLRDKVIDKLKEMATPITKDNFDVLRNVAAVSNNNDSKTGELLFEMFKDVGANAHITIDTSYTYQNEDSYSTVPGMGIPYGPINPAFFNKASRVDGEWENAYVFMFEDKITKDDLSNGLLDMMGLIFAQLHMPIIVIAPGYDIEFVNGALSSIAINRQKNIDLQLMLTQFNTSQKDLYDDLATYLGGRPIDKTDAEWSAIAAMFNENPMQFAKTYLGKAGKVKADLNETIFTDGDGDQEVIEQRIANLEKEIDAIKTQKSTAHTEKEIFNRQTRINALTGKSVYYAIGASTEAERETKRYLIEDAIAASKSALKNGYVTGGNLSLVYAIRHIEPDNDTQKKLIPLLTEAFAKPYYKVLDNAGKITHTDDIQKVIKMSDDKFIYNLKTEVLESFSDTGIINSVETDIKIIDSAISIVSLLALSNQFIFSDTRKMESALTELAEFRKQDEEYIHGTTLNG